MTIPLYLSVATIAYSLVFPPKNSSASASAPSRTVVTATVATGGSNRHFLSGVGENSF
jgi:hypothetical protein